MEVTMADVAELGLSGCMPNVGWASCSPVVGWEPFSGEDDHQAMKIAMKWDTATAASDEYCHSGSPPEALDYGSSTVSDSTFSSAVGSPAEYHLNPYAAAAGETDLEARLVHLLSAAAETISGENNGQKLARVILTRLKQLLPPTAAFANGGGATGKVRLVAHFADALHRLLSDGIKDCVELPFSSPEAMSAAQLLQDMSPYVNFGYFTANQAILEAVLGERRVHIVDFDVGEGAQWAPLMQAFLSWRGGAPMPSHLKITAVTGGRKSGAAAAVQNTGRRLAAFAELVGLPFSFALCRLDRNGSFRPAAVKMVRGETLVFNCALHPPNRVHQSAAAVESFLTGAAEMGARVVTLVEEEGGSVASAGEGFVGRFFGVMRRYSAIWDALEDGFPMHGRVREMVERLVLGPRIAGAVEVAFRWSAEENAPEFGWAGVMEEAGFRAVAVSFFNLWQAKLLLGLFNFGYLVEEEAENKLVLYWKSLRLVSASVWSAPPPSTAASATEVP